uniref:peptidyl-tRNA hydrolase n=1 Tax=Aegilops tauschii TaxID=37682 RepID=N1QWX1_AEGTA
MAAPPRRNPNHGGKRKVLVVRQDLKMGAGKIASQCAHAATGLYADLLASNRVLLRQWEQFGPCKNQQEMNRIKETAEHRGIPTFVVADAGQFTYLLSCKGNPLRAFANSMRPIMKRPSDHSAY